jgi:hypothetical protein
MVNAARRSALRATTFGASRTASAGSGELKLHRAEGDINLSAARTAWQASHLNQDTKALLEEDADVFLHQALSTPCLNALEGAEGIYLRDTQGRLIMDFHGNSLRAPGRLRQSGRDRRGQGAGA